MECTVFDFLSGRIVRLNCGKGTEPVKPVVAGWQAPDCLPVYGHHDSSLRQICPDRRSEPGGSIFEQLPAATRKWLH